MGFQKSGLLVPDIRVNHFVTGHRNGTPSISGESKSCVVCPSRDNLLLRRCQLDGCRESGEVLHNGLSHCDEIRCGVNWRVIEKLNGDRLGLKNWARQIPKRNV
jgi:hypothetical protein